MTTPTFNPPIAPSTGLSDTPEVKLLTASFGGGYSQITRDGPNHIRSVRELTWEVLDLDQRNEIVGFLEERGGDLPFLWQLPTDAKPIRFTCPKWASTVLPAGFHRVTATFRQNFSMAA